MKRKPERDVNLTVRVPVQIRKDLAESAKRKKRTMTAETAWRLADSFLIDTMRNEIRVIAAKEIRRALENVITISEETYRESGNRVMSEILGEFLVWYNRLRKQKDDETAAGMKKVIEPSPGLGH